MVQVSEEPVRLLYGIAAEKEIGTLRLFAALIVSLCSCWLLVACRFSYLAWLGAVMGWAGTGVWIGLWSRSIRVRRERQGTYLELDPMGFSKYDGASHERFLWHEVKLIEADEAKIALKVAGFDCESMWLEPSYGGLGLHELEAFFLRYHRVYGQSSSHALEHAPEKFPKGTERSGACSNGKG